MSPSSASMPCPAVPAMTLPPTRVETGRALRSTSTGSCTTVSALATCSHADPMAAVKTPTRVAHARAHSPRERRREVRIFSLAKDVHFADGPPVPRVDPPKLARSDAPVLAHAGAALGPEQPQGATASAHAKTARAASRLTVDAMEGARVPHRVAVVRQR